MNPAATDHATNAAADNVTDTAADAATDTVSTPADAAEDLERRLGPVDPADAHVRDLADEREEFPQADVDALDGIGLARHYVPVEHGGLLRDYPSTAAMIRAVAGRDLTMAIAHGKTFLGAVSVWVAGSGEQAARVAGLVSAGVPVSWGLTERGHGSDLVAGEVTAYPDGDRVRLDGEKWLINNATRGGLVTVLARSDPAGGPRGFDLYLVDRRTAGDSYRPLPKVRTLGIRGADISGFTLDGVLLDPDADRVGAPGSGLETVMRSLQLTRTLCATLSLGAADHGLAEAAHFAADRRLYGRPLLDLPAAGRTLAECYADHLLHEAFATLATRAIHTLPGELGILAPAVKYLVPVGTEQLLARLRRLLGARAWLRDVRGTEVSPGVGVFQKIERDHRIVSLFDGNTVVNLNSLVSQFPLLGRAHRRPRPAEAGLYRAADLGAPLPPADPSRLRLMPTRGAGLLHDLPAAAAQLAELAAENGRLTPIAESARSLAERTGELLEDVAEQPIVPPDVPAHAFDLARRLTWALAGAAAVRLWLDSHSHVSRTALGPESLWTDGRWLHAALDRVHTRLVAGHRPTADEERALEETYAALTGELLRQTAGHRFPSLLHTRRAEAL
ncbi:acyl-CoA dehydrogenase family protein [Streptomyces durbertensis]|uniref:Acyl-CoA dehydrogenase family protein n=1 Tax=Streptomyces durbertensis TaxID=2448886 RepID=A0ABR6EBV9_9ACTN|nr:acyl-CoA dehydrogenase family protein [Streptomyces durbertensis]MBB1242653.1 acyl-CoA dehydrogenase family protein [Streptomyces durbertensis]